VKLINYLRDREIEAYFNGNRVTYWITNPNLTFNYNCEWNDLQTVYFSAYSRHGALLKFSRRAHRIDEGVDFFTPYVFDALFPEVLLFIRKMKGKINGMN
jgi:hypothetical protein